MKEVTKQTTKEKIIFILIIICLLCWIISVSNTQVYKIDITAIGPFQYLPLIFWPALLIIVYLNLIPSKPLIKLILMLITCLMTFGTIAIITPYGVPDPDTLTIMSSAQLIFKTGTIYASETSAYESCYPSSFLFNAILQGILGISVKDITRFYPLILLPLYLFGVIILVNSISNHFNFKKEERFSIFNLSILAFAIFVFSISIRLDLVPQNFALVLLPYLLGVFFVSDIRWRAISIIILFTLISTHYITSCIMLLLIFMLVVVDKKSLQRLMFPVVLWATWVIYIGILHLKSGFDILYSIFMLETSIESATGKLTALGGLDIPGMEFYLFSRRLTLVMIGLLLLFSFLYLLIKKRKLAFLLLGFLLCISPLLSFWILKSPVFVYRAIEFSAVFISMIFGFGLHEFFKNRNKEKDYYKNHGKTTLKTLFTLIIVIMILITSFLSVFTAQHAVTVAGTTDSQVAGTEFLVFGITEPLLLVTRKPLALDYKNRPINKPLSANTDMPTFLRNSKGVIIGISTQWVNSDKISHKSEVTPLTQSEEWLNKHPGVVKIYDNGYFRGYLK